MIQYVTYIRGVDVIDRHVYESEILGESVRLSCDVSEERLRKISECINEKAEEIQRNKRGLPVSTPLFKLLVNVNLADDLVCAREQLAQLRSKTTALEKELARMRRELKEHANRLERQSGKQG